MLVGMDPGVCQIRERGKNCCSAILDYLRRDGRASLSTGAEMVHPGRERKDADAMLVDGKKWRWAY